MIKYIIFFLSLCNLAHSQEIKVFCGDTIKYQKLNNRYRIELGKEVTSFEPENIDNQFKTKLDISCITNGFDVILTKQNGNEYEIYHFIFSKVGDSYFWDRCYLDISNRQDQGLLGMLVKNIPLNNFKGITKEIENNFKSISYVSGLQEGQEVEKTPFYNRVKRAYEKKRYADIKLFTDPFVIDWKNVMNYESVERLNNIAFYAYKAGAFLNAINILDSLIKKYPNRVIAYLNLADAYWKNGDKENAKLNYNKYIEILKSTNKDLKKIPKYVYQRIR